MPKKTTGRRKGIQRCLPRHRVGGNKLVGGQKWLRRSIILKFGKKCFDISFAVCEKFHMIGFRREESGEYVPVTGKALIWHYVVVMVCLGLSIHKTWATVYVFMYKELQMESFMCMMVCLVYDGAILLTLGVLYTPKETMDLLNSWSYVPASSNQFDGQSSEFHPLNNVSACVKTVASSLVGQGTCCLIGLLSLVSMDAPVFLRPTATSLGLIPEGILPKWAWAIMFVPLDILATQPFMLVSCLNANILFMANGAIAIFVERLRAINVLSMQSRRNVEQMYVQLELFNRVAQVWIRFYFPSWLLVISLGIINTVFLAIRYTTELPMMPSILFPYIGTNLLVLIFWQSYDMLQVIRASEDILGKLWQHEAPYFRGLTRANRVELMKRSKAMRPLAFPLGDSEFSLNLPISTWDEIINQLLFLLSL